MPDDIQKTAWWGVAGILIACVGLGGVLLGWWTNTALFLLVSGAFGVVLLLEGLGFQNLYPRPRSEDRDVPEWRPVEPPTEPRR